MLKTPINIILQVKVNYNSFKKDYQNNFLNQINLDEIKDDLDIVNIDRLIFNGGWYRNFYYLADNILHKTEIYIRKLNCITENGKNHYISVWPQFVIKYNPLSVDLIEYMATNVRKDEDIFLDKNIEDPNLILDCEDFLHYYCLHVEKACELNNFSASLNANYTQNYNQVLNVFVKQELLNNMRYPKIYILHKTGQAYQGSSGMVLSYLNLVLNFLR